MSRTTRLRTSAAALALVASMTMLAACGGGGDATTDSTQGTPLTKDEFIAQADQICKTGNDKLKADAKALGSNPSQAQIETYVNDSLVPTIQDELNGLSALGAPAGDEEQVSAIIDAAQSGVDQIASDPSQLTDPNSDAFTEANQLANDYGLTECGGSS